MRPGHADAEQIIASVVAGGRPWTDLQPLGMEAQPDAGQCVFLPTFPSDARVSVSDVVRGFRAHLHDPRQLRQWAFLVEALPFEFIGIEWHPAGEALMAAVWSASFGEPLRNDQIELIQALAREDEYDP